VASTAFVDIGALDCATMSFSVAAVTERIYVVGLSRQNLGVKHELAAGSASMVVTIEALTPSS